MRPKRARFRIASSGRLRGLLLALIAVGSCGIAVVAFATHALKSLEGSSVDLRFSIRGNDPTPKNLVIVKVDDKTFQDIKKQWPFPRAMHGQLISRITAEHPAAIAYDVQFSEKSLRGQNDDIAM